MPVLSELAAPFYEGLSVSSLVPSVFQVALDGRPYVIEPREYRRVFLPPQRSQIDDSEEPGEQTLNPEGLWRRARSDWGLGAGQVWLDEEESSPRRFASSLGVDPWADRELSLLPATVNKRASANTNLKLLSAGGYVYVMDGGNLLFGNTPTATDWTGFTAATGLPGGTLLDVTTTGTHVYVVGSDNSIYRSTIGTTAFTLWFNPAAVVTRLWYAIGRLIASDGRSLYEITAVPGETLIFTHPTVDFGWTDVVGTPAGMYAAGANADRGEIRYTKINTAGTAFEAPVVAAEFQSETVRALAVTGPLLLIATSFGLRSAEINPVSLGGSLLYGPVVTAPGDVRCLSVDTIGAETFVWFGWTNITTAVTGLGRARPARFTDVLVPAYATDVHATGQGAVMSTVSLGGRRYFAVSGVGFFGATGDKIASGTLTTGRIRFRLLDAKVFVDTTWRTAPLNGTVALSATFDDGSTITAGNQTEQSSLRPPSPASMANRSMEWVELTFTLTRATDTTLGPILRWWVLRAIPAPVLNQRILLPIIMREKVATPQGQQVKPQSVLEEMARLSDMVRSQRVVSYQEGRRSESVYIVNFELRPDQWNPISDAFEGLLMVEMHTT